MVVSSNATFQGFQLPDGSLMASLLLKNPLFHNEDIFQFLIQYNFEKCFLGFEIQVFTNFLPVCWRRILLTYISWQLIFVYCYAAIFYLKNTTGEHNLLSLSFFFKQHRKFSLKSALLIFVSEKILSQLMFYMACLFCTTDLKTNHSRIWILALLDSDRDGASTATNTVLLSFYCISEDNLELKLSWVVDIIWFQQYTYIREYYEIRPEVHFCGASSGAKFIFRLKLTGLMFHYFKSTYIVNNIKITY